MTFVVVQRARHTGLRGLHAMLARSSSMEVVEARNGMRLRPNRVHVIPVDLVMALRRGRLRTRAAGHGRSVTGPIDGFLRSLASDAASRAIVVDLSGGGDGADGLRAVRAAGGTVLVPDRWSKPGARGQAIDRTRAMEALARELRAACRHSRAEAEAARPSAEILLASLDLAVVVVDLDHRVRRFTPRATSILDLEVGRSIHASAPCKRAPNLDHLISDALASVRRRELEIPGRDGRWYRVEIHPQRGGGAGIVGAVLAFIDIHGLKQATATAAAAYEEASAVQRAIPVPLVVLDDQLSVRSANPAYYERYAVEPGATIGRPWLDTCDGAWDSHRLRSALAGLLSAGGELELVVEVEWPAGNLRTVAVTACVLRRGADAPIVLVTPVDVTDRTRLLHAAMEAHSLAERASQAKDVFFATLSHELRAPLHTILLHADLLLADAASDPARSRQSAASIIRAAEVQARIVDDLLDVSAIISGKIAIQRRPVQLQALIAAALESIRASAARKKIQLHVALDRSVGAVLGDDARLQQVVSNLLGNSVKFTPEGGEIAISLDRVGDSARIRVSDTGRGIEPGLLTRVFDRFVQGDEPDSRSQRGLGLGLAIVQDLVRLHGGRVSAESEGPGRGATFTVDLPLAALREEAAGGPGADPPGRDAHRMAALADAAAARREFDGVRILLVDDDEGSREVFSEILRFHGAEVETVERAADVLPVLIRLRPDVVLCDIAMPDEDGYRLIRRIRDLPPEEGGRVPAVAVTALATQSDRQRALSAGFQLHVAKPAPANVLVDAVRRVRTAPLPPG